MHHPIIYENTASMMSLYKPLFYPVLILFFACTPLLAQELDNPQDQLLNLNIQSLKKRTDHWYDPFGYGVFQPPGAYLPAFERMVVTGDTLLQRKQYDEAKSWYLNTIPYYQLFDKNTVASLYFQLGKASTRNDESVAFYVKGLNHLLPRKENEVLKAKFQTNMAIIFTKINNFNKAIVYYDQAIVLFRQNNDALNLAKALCNKAYAYNLLGDEGKSLSCFKTALEAVAQSTIPSHRELKGIIIQNMIGVYLQQNNADSAISYLNLLRFNLEEGSVQEKIGYQFLSGYVFGVLNDHKNAKIHLLHSLAIAEKEKIEEIIPYIYRALAISSSELQEYRQAWYFGQKYINERYHYFEQTKKELNNVNNIETQYHLARKDNELAQKQLIIARQEKNLVQKNLIMVIIGLGATALLIIGWIFYRSYHRKQRLMIKDKEIEQLKAMMKGEEKERSRLARELHDGIGGMLAAIKMNVGAIKIENPETAHINRLDKVALMLQDTSIEVRKTAHNLMPDILDRHSLEEALTAFCKQVNTGNGLLIELHMPGDLPALDKSIELMLYRMVQELVQNVIKHARANHLELQIMHYDQLLSITAEDNGQGFDTETTPEGVGLANLRHRVAVLQGSLSVTTVPGSSTTVHIEFDLEQLLRG